MVATIQNDSTKNNIAKIQTEFQEVITLLTNEELEPTEACNEFLFKRLNAMNLQEELQEQH